MLSRYFLFIILFFTASAYAQESSPASSVGVSSTSNRLEELFIWKVSEDLELSVKQEKDISAMIRDLDQKKSDQSEKIDGLQKQMSDSGSDGDARKLLSKYRDLMKDYNQISVNEIDRVQKLLSAKQAVKYFVVKSQLSQKIRSMLGTSARTEAHGQQHPHTEKPAALPEPKIIEE